jgi:hypothetical protein
MALNINGTSKTQWTRELIYFRRAIRNTHLPAHPNTHPKVWRRWMDVSEEQGISPQPIRRSAGTGQSSRNCIGAIPTVGGITPTSQRDQSRL